MIAREGARALTASPDRAAGAVRGRRGERAHAGLGALALVVVVIVGASGPAGAQRVPGWEVRVAERVELAPGASGAIAIAIAVDRGLTVSRDAPVIIDLAPPPGVTLRRRRVGRGDAVDPGADAPRFAVPVRADQPGDHAVGIRVRFWVCGGKVCRPIDRRYTSVIAVSAPPPDAGVGP